MTSHFSGYCHCGFHAQFGVCTWAATAAAWVRAQQFLRSNPFRGWVRSHTVPVFACPVQKESCPGSPGDGLDLSICSIFLQPVTCKSPAFWIHGLSPWPKNQNVSQGLSCCTAARRCRLTLAWRSWSQILLWQVAAFRVEQMSPEIRKTGSNWHGARKKKVFCGLVGLKS